VALAGGRAGVLTGSVCVWGGPQLTASPSSPTEPFPLAEELLVRGRVVVWTRGTHVVLSMAYEEHVQQAVWATFRLAAEVAAAAAATPGAGTDTPAGADEDRPADDDVRSWGSVGVVWATAAAAAGGGDAGPGATAAAAGGPLATTRAERVLAVLTGRQLHLWVVRTGERYARSLPFRLARVAALDVGLLLERHVDAAAPSPAASVIPTLYTLSHPLAELRPLALAGTALPVPPGTPVAGAAAPATPATRSAAAMGRLALFSPMVATPLRRPLVEAGTDMALSPLPPVRTGMAGRPPLPTSLLSCVGVVGEAAWAAALGTGTPMPAMRLLLLYDPVGHVHTLWRYTMPASLGVLPSSDVTGDTTDDPSPALAVAPASFASPAPTPGAPSPAGPRHPVPRRLSLLAGMPITSPLGGPRSAAAAAEAATGPAGETVALFTPAPAATARRTGPEAGRRSLGRSSLGAPGAGTLTPAAAAATATTVTTAAGGLSATLGGAMATPGAAGVQLRVEGERFVSPTSGRSPAPSDAASAGTGALPTTARLARLSEAAPELALSCVWTGDAAATGGPATAVAATVPGEGAVAHVHMVHPDARGASVLVTVAVPLAAPLAGRTVDVRAAVEAAAAVAGVGARPGAVAELVVLGTDGRLLLLPDVTVPHRVRVLATLDPLPATKAAKGGSGPRPAIFRGDDDDEIVLVSPLQTPEASAPAPLVLGRAPQAPTQTPLLLPAAIAPLGSGTLLVTTVAQRRYRVPVQPLRPAHPLAAWVVDCVASALPPDLAWAVHTVLAALCHGTVDPWAAALAVLAAALADGDVRPVAPAAVADPPRGLSALLRRVPALAGLTPDVVALTAHDDKPVLPAALVHVAAQELVVRGATPASISPHVPALLKAVHAAHETLRLGPGSTRAAEWVHACASPLAAWAGWSAHVAYYAQRHGVALATTGLGAWLWPKDAGSQRAPEPPVDDALAALLLQPQASPVPKAVRDGPRAHAVALWRAVASGRAPTDVAVALFEAGLRPAGKTAARASLSISARTQTYSRAWLWCR
jgi:hypothetical protein